MSWQNEMALIVRHLVNDLDSSDYTFTNDRLEEAILVSAQLASLEIDFENTYTIEVDGSSLSPDPTSSSNKDASFINIVSLKTACLLLSSEGKTNALSAMAPRLLIPVGLLPTYIYCTNTCVRNTKTQKCNTNLMVLWVKLYLARIHPEAIT